MSDHLLLRVDRPSSQATGFRHSLPALIPCPAKPSVPAQVVCIDAIVPSEEFTDG